MVSNYLYPSPEKMRRIREMHFSNSRTVEGNMALAKIHYNWLNSSHKHYTLSFEQILKGGNIGDFLWKKFKKRKINALDLGGVGNELFFGIMADTAKVKFAHTYGITLHNTAIEENVGSWHHQGLMADLLRKETFFKIW